MSTKKLSPMIVKKQKEVEKRMMSLIKWGMKNDSLYNPIGAFSFPSIAEFNAIERLETAGKIRGVKGRILFRGYVTTK
jgi:hypothetical protein